LHLPKRPLAKPLQHPPRVLEPSISQAVSQMAGERRQEIDKRDMNRDGKLDACRGSANGQPAQITAS